MKKVMQRRPATKFKARFRLLAKPQRAVEQTEHQDTGYFGRRSFNLQQDKDMRQKHFTHLDNSGLSRKNHQFGFTVSTKPRWEAYYAGKVFKLRLCLQNEGCNCHCTFYSSIPSGSQAAHLDLLVDSHLALHTVHNKL